MTDRHKYAPVRFRPPEADRARLLSYAAEAGRPVNAVLAEALAEYLDRREEDLRDLERRANHPCPGCGHLPAAHEGGRPSTTLYCHDCPDGICYAWTPGGGEVGPGALPRTASTP